jgi:ribosomal protein S18 acetylase RimI-like enzyme
MSGAAGPFAVRNTAPGDFPAIVDLTREVYPDTRPWRPDQLASHLELFPKGQFVATDNASGRVVGMAASLIVRWRDYQLEASWRDITEKGMFTNHDPVRGRTLYAAEVMVHPSCQRKGIGTMLYAARMELARRLRLPNIRASARLRGYHLHAGRMGPEEYVGEVRRGTLRDPTLSFQLGRGFRVVGVVGGYLRHDSESLGYAAVIEWTNPEAALFHDAPRHREQTAGRERRPLSPRPRPE